MEIGGSYIVELFKLDNIGRYDSVFGRPYLSLNILELVD